RAAGGNPPRQRRARDPQLPPADRSAGRQGQAAGAAGRRLQRGFAVFAKEDQNVQSTLKLPPGALAKTRSGLGKLATATDVLGPTLRDLHPFARALGPAQEATRRLALKTTPIIRDEIRPFARQILPTISALRPDTRDLAEAFPKLATSFAV